MSETVVWPPDGFHGTGPYACNLCGALVRLADVGLHRTWHLPGPVVTVPPKPGGKP